MSNHDRTNPVGSLSDIKRTDDSLVIAIHPLGKMISFGWIALFLIFSAILINAIIISLTILAIYAIFRIGFASIIVLILLLLPWRVAFDFNCLFLSLASKINITINIRNFSINSDFYGVKHHKYGKTEDLRSIEIVAFKMLKKLLPYKSQLCLTYGGGTHPERNRSYKFGLALFRPEQEWLVREINNFLEFSRSQNL